MKIKATVFLLAISLATQGLASGTPKGGAKDIRIRTAVYDSQQVYLIETDQKFDTTIHFGKGERFMGLTAGDTESFEIVPLKNLGNVVSIKPHVAGAVTNMTVITNRRTYAFELREGHISGRTGRFYQVHFEYPNERKRSASGGQVAKTYNAPKNYNYGVSGNADFEPASVWDDGRYTYFTFAENIRQPSVFKVDGTGRERTVNWTQQGNTVRVLGLSPAWTLRIDDQELCVAKNTSALSVGN